MTKDGLSQTSHSILKPFSSKPFVASSLAYTFRGIGFSQDSLFIASVGKQSLVSVHSLHGEELYTFPTDRIRIRSPYGICVSRNDVFITDISFNTVSKYSISGDFITSVGKKGRREGEFNLPYGIAVDSYGRLFVTDNRNNRIQVFTPNLEFITSLGSGLFNRVSDASFFEDDTLVVLDNSGMRLHQLNQDLCGVRTVETNIVPPDNQYLLFPLFFCIDPLENIFVADRYSMSVQMFDNQLVKIRTIRTHSGELFDPKGIICYQDGAVICLSDKGPFIRFFNI